MSHVNPVDVVANVGTGGLYEAGKGIAEGRPLQAASTLGPFGSVVQPTLGTGPALAGDLIGAGAGIGGALAGGGSSSLGGGVADFGPGPMVGVDVNGAPLYLVKTAAGVSEMTAGQAAAAGIPSFTAGGLAGGALAGAGGGGGTGALMGAGAGGTAAQLAQALTAQPGMNIPSAFPTGGALPGGPTPAQLGAVASEKHPGLAPWYAMRQRGQQPPGGIAEPGSTAALGIMNQNPNLWMQR